MSKDKGAQKTTAISSYKRPHRNNATPLTLEYPGRQNLFFQNISAQAFWKHFYAFGASLPLLSVSQYRSLKLKQ